MEKGSDNIKSSKNEPIKKNPKTKASEYVSADKLKKEDLQKTIPLELRPTKRFSYIFGGIFIAILLVSFLQFPFSSFLSGNVENMAIEIGIPLRFFVFDLNDPEVFPLKVDGLLLDIAIYLIVAYAIEVALNVFMRSSVSKAIRRIKNEKEAKPELYELKKDSEK